MQSENNRRLIRNVAVVGGIVLILILIFLVIQGIFFSGAKPSETQLTNALINTSTDRGVQMTVRGPIVGNEDARSYEVVVTPTSRSVTQYSGYDGTVVNKQVYSNSTSSYEQFVYALNKAGMMNSRTTSDTDTRGVCATGDLYTFALERDTTIQSSLWTSDCSSDRGTLDIRPSSLTYLFNAQIPDINKYRIN